MDKGHPMLGLTLLKVLKRRVSRLKKEDASHQLQSVVTMS